LYQIKDQSFIDPDLVLWGLGFDIEIRELLSFMILPRYLRS